MKFFSQVVNAEFAKKHDNLNKNHVVPSEELF